MASQANHQNSEFHSPNSTDEEPSAQKRPIRWATARLVLIGLGLVVALVILLVVPVFPAGQVTLEVGDVAPEDIRAPRYLEYVSQIELQQQQDRAEATVAEIYDPPETRVGRQQVRRADEILAYFTSIRSDPYATPQQQAEWINAVPDVDLSPSDIERILTLADKEWANVRQEVPTTLSRAMRESIRQQDLAQARRNVPALVSLTLNDEEVAVVSALVQAMLVPNTFVNKAATEAARKQARDAVEGVPRSYQTGEIILRAGEVVTEVDLEALQRFGLLQEETNWRDLVGAVGIIILVTLLLGVGLVRYKPALLTERSRDVLLAALIFVLFVLLAKLMVPGRAVLPYLYPAAGLSMLMTVLLNPEMGILSTIALAAIVGHIANGSLEMATFATAGGLAGALMLRRVARVNAFFWTGVYVGVVNVIVVLSFQLTLDAIDAVGMLTLLAVSFASGALAASLTLAIFFLVGNLFDVTTALQLLDLSRPSHPLLTQLLLKAPGTYHHTLMVANLAEQAAERIEADPLLVRVGAYYHDIGKTVRPYFFTENQLDGVNPHDQLDPYTSASVLIAHVIDGLDLAKRYRLPSRVRAFIPEHQGDARVSFMYQKAVELAGGDESQVDEALFHYPGPKPQSRETALLMLADVTEAVVKSRRPASAEEMEKVVRDAIQMRVEQGQLDECDLTLQDLEAIRRSFVDTLKGVYHSRVKYPEAVKVQDLPKIEQDGAEKDESEPS